MVHLVLSYKLHFRITPNSYGVIELTLQGYDQNPMSLNNLTPDKFSAIASLLKHSPVFYNTLWGGFSTQEEAPAV